MTFGESALLRIFIYDLPKQVISALRRRIRVPAAAASTLIIVLRIYANRDTTIDYLPLGKKTPIATTRRDRDYLRLGKIFQSIFQSIFQ